MADIEDDLLTLHEDILDENEEGVKEILSDFQKEGLSILELCSKETRLPESDPEWGKQEIILLFFYIFVSLFIFVRLLKHI